MDIPVQSVTACLQGCIASNTPVINLSTLEYFLWIRIPHNIAREYELYQASQSLPKKADIDNFKLFIEQECRKPWLKITSKILDVSVGFHQYELKFINRYTNDIVTLYFAYIIQNDMPEKSYMYMDNERNASSEVEV